MTYDRDLQSARRAAQVMGAVNAVFMLYSLWIHAWVAALGGFVWSVNILIWLGILKTQQSTRDLIRINMAGLNGVLDRTREDL